MTINEGIEKLKHGMEEALYEVGEAINEAKEHMILSVRNHSYMIALLLMSITSAILVFGTIYVWCFHHGHPYSEEDISEHVETDGAAGKKKKPRTEKNETVTENDTDKCKHAENVEKVENIDADVGKSAIADKNGDVRQRKASTGASVNNDSPVKSRIPVRRQKSKPS